MKNPIITLKRVQAISCPEGGKAFTRYFGKDAELSLQTAARQLAPKKNAWSDLAWGIDMFGRPTKADTKKAMFVLNYSLTPSRLRAAVYALKSFLRGDYEEAMYSAIEADPEAVVCALFPESTLS